MGRTKQTIDMLLHLWPIGRVLNWLGRKPFLARVLDPWFNSQSNHAVMIPIHQAIEGPRSVVLPYLLLPPLIEQASECVALNYCMCRMAENCQAFPKEIGCLILGPGAEKIHPSMGRRLSRVEARQHIDRAMQVGLVPLIVHTAFDAMVLGIPYRSMLAICFCCDCCCTVRSSLRMGPPAFWDSVERLPGMRMVVLERCSGCGLCVEDCPMQAIRIVEGKAEISDQCKGCGRCLTTCIRGCIQIEAQDTAILSDLVMNKLRERTNLN